MKILVVDDEPTILITTAHILSNLNIRTAVQTAAGLQEAKDALTRGRFDLVISDLSLSGRNGTEGLELLSHIKNTSSDTEVFIMTGYGSEGIREAAYRRGALWYFEKPLAMEKILLKVQEVAVSKGFDDITGDEGGRPS